jgi:uncharacterized protein
MRKGNRQDGTASDTGARASHSSARGEQRRARSGEASLRVERSKIHGRGVFAAAPIRKGERIIEYKGRRVKWSTASKAYRDVEGKPTHTFLFELDDVWVIDATQGGNKARWINHSCNPNCRAVQEGDRIFIEAIRTIRQGEELGYDYNIRIEDRLTPSEKKRWPCFCGARACRGTLLVPKRKRAAAIGAPTARSRPRRPAVPDTPTDSVAPTAPVPQRPSGEPQLPAEPMRWDEAA